MNLERTCRSCKISETCPEKKYTPGDRVTKERYISCMYFTCSLNGKQAARDAIRYENFEGIKMDGGNVGAARFGTGCKPTQYPEQEFERLVTKHGEIIVKTSDGEYKFSGQNAYR